MAELNPKRAVAEMKELRALTSNEMGNQRVAFTPTWIKALDFFKKKLDELGLSYRQDAAGNLWATLEGDRPEFITLGGHLDSVPNGGWLDGCWNVIAALEVVRYLKSKGKPPLTVKLVSWCDEEGARFGRSLFGSSAFSGHLDIESVRNLKDREGVALVDALKNVGIKLEDAPKATAERAGCLAYLELHIEQGPVLEAKGYPLGVVLGTVGVERNFITFHGQAAHSGSTPMAVRKDAFRAAGLMAQEIYRIAKKFQGVCTIGSCVTKPGIVTSVVEDCTITLDQRHLDAKKLAGMWADAQDTARKIAKQLNVEVAFGDLWRIEPILFHPELIEFCDQSIVAAAGKSMRLPSGPLHDAAEVCRAGIPTQMVFVQSLRGISHNKIEDTKEEHLEMSVQALANLADKTIPWALSKK
ncbi:MAG TPA: hydantoinase/carbamoylase family amidase [Spirochaetia bacterium]|nr:hydantoinase/carbamoylase family amidase [Spirochaetia bacterium]